MKINQSTASLGQVKVQRRSDYYYLTVLAREGESNLKLRPGMNQIKPPGRWEWAEYLEITDKTLTHYYKHPVVKNYWVEPETYYWQENKSPGEKYLLLDPEEKILSWLKRARAKKAHAH